VRITSPRSLFPVSPSFGRTGRLTGADFPEEDFGPGIISVLPQTTVNSVVGVTEGDDLIQEIFEYLNSPTGPKNLKNSRGNQLMSALLTYMGNVKKDATTIAGLP
jgi:hypothetical protein